MGDGRVRDAPGLDWRTQGAGHKARPSRRALGGDPAADRPVAAGGVDLESLGERSVYVDCDVLQADGGTRCAAITGGYVALRLALAGLKEADELERDPLTGSIAAVSCGVVDGDPLLDLDYSEDSRAEVDANVVMSGDGGLVEVQATAERTPVSRASLTTSWPSPSRRSPCFATSSKARSTAPLADAASAGRGRHPQPGQASRAGGDARLAGPGSAP